MSKSSLLLGVDPGTTTGMALYNEAEDTLIELWTTDFWGAWNYFMVTPAHTICIEVPANKRIFHQAGKNVANIQVTARKVGGVIREAELLANGAELLGKKVIRIEPQGKMDREKFNRLTGWTGQSNEHQRDAALQVMRRRTGR